jgi:hypothetical protein
MKRFIRRFAINAAVALGAVGSMLFIVVPLFFLITQLPFPYSVIAYFAWIFFAIVLVKTILDFLIR